MRLLFSVGISIAALGAFSRAIAGQMTPVAADASDTIISSGQGRAEMLMGSAVVQIAAVTQEVLQFASTADVATARPAETPTPLSPGQSADTRAKPATAKHIAAETLAGTSDKSTASRNRREELLVADAKPMLVRPIGKSETGTAAWYGGRYIGRQTSSGVRLDTIHPTCAHRTLPLNSLVRVTNLRNGRSVVVRVTDRGPLAESLLIDMSPRAADELRMKEAGLVPVQVEQVVEVSPDTK
jgi:rare lipoprotein A (peptidoglycan hydrolase)